MVPALFLTPSLSTPRVPQREFSLHPRCGSSVRSHSTFRPPSRSTPPGDGAPSENEKTPPPPAEFSPVTIGSLARGTNSGLHEAEPLPPSHPRRPMAGFLCLARSFVRFHAPHSSPPSPPSFLLLFLFQPQAWIVAVSCPVRPISPLYIPLSPLPSRGAGRKRRIADFNPAGDFTVLNLAPFPDTAFLLA